MSAHGFEQHERIIRYPELKKVQKCLVTITGSLCIKPIYSLGDTVHRLVG